MTIQNIIIKIFCTILETRLLPGAADPSRLMFARLSRPLFALVRYLPTEVPHLKET